MIDGMVSVLGRACPITGGLVGDDGAFVKTYTFQIEAVTTDHIVALVSKVRK